MMNYIDIDLSDIGYTLMDDVDYPAYLQPFHRSLPFLPEKRVNTGIIILVSTFSDKKYVY